MSGVTRRSATSKSGSASPPPVPEIRSIAPRVAGKLAPEALTRRAA
jgi:hypothetical protein